MDYACGWEASPYSDSYRCMHGAESYIVVFVEAIISILLLITAHTKYAVLLCIEKA